MEPEETPISKTDVKNGKSYLDALCCIGKALQSTILWSIFVSLTSRVYDDKTIDYHFSFRQRLGRIKGNNDWMIFDQCMARYSLYYDTWQVMSFNASMSIFILLASQAPHVAFI
uniref:Uncharacterized protein n=1 Tax=Romanomermis culicivorax TaxID=13658 RepID=A0A915K7Z1_ROMCU